MRGFKGSFLLVVAVISFLSVSQPAQAQQIVHDPTSLAKMLADAAQNVLKMLSGITNIFGTTGATMPGTLGSIDGVPVVEQPCVYTTLVQFMDRCQKQQRRQEMAYNSTVQQQFMTALQVDNKRNLDAQMQIQHKQRVDEKQVDAYADALGRDAAFCETPSMNRSTLAQIFIAQMMLEEQMNQIAKEMDGDASMPAYAHGDQQYALDTIAARKNAGLISCTGNDGGNDKICSGGGDTPYVNADQKSTTLTGSWVLDDQDQKAFSEKYANMYINNLFDERSFPPVRKDQVDKLTGPAAEVLNDRAGYAAAMSEFMRPFLEDYNERRGTEGLAAFDSLDAVLARAGITGETRDRLIKGNKTSLKGGRFIRYKVYMHDPKTATELANTSALNQGNILAFIAQRDMDQVALLYDVTDTLEQTNRLLGLIGAELARQRKKEIVAETSSIAASSETP